MIGSLIYKKKRFQIFREMVALVLLVLVDKITPKTINGIKISIHIRKLSDQLDERGDWLWDKKKMKGLF